ncbi:MAG: anthrone oxygenase family protein [Bacteroidota bacterium]
MEISASNITLFATILLVGLVAGLCFTWGNAVTPGIGQLDDLGYLKAFQKMNRSIENPLFFVVFMGSFPVGIAAIFMNKGIALPHFWLILIAVVIYFLGVVLVTVLGNVSLNQILDKTDLLGSSITELQELRQKFEQPWNRFHTIRIFASFISFAMLVLAAINK